MAVQTIHTSAGPRDLTHGLTATTTGGSVTLGGNTYPAKDAIKAAGFRWIDRTWRGTTANLAKLEATLAGTKGYAVTAPKFPPTTEQTRIVAAVKTGRDVVIQAGAGAGKTSTLELIAAAQPGKQFLLIVFNKTAQLDAQGRMPRNVECRTFDSLGFAGAPQDMVAKFKAQRDAAWGSPHAPVRRLVEVGAYLGMDTDPIKVPVEIVATVGGKTVTRTEIATLTPARAASIALRAVEMWCTTADPEVTRGHIAEPDNVAQAILPVARKVWADVLSATGRIRVTNGHLTKVWALGRPDLTDAGTGPRKPPAVIMVDEAQDTAPVVEAVMMAQTVQMIAVGDSAQAIYAWRGAQDFLAHIDVPDGQRLTLTQSWRFGPQIAAVGNAFLNRLHNPFVIEGAGKSGRVIAPDTMYRPDAVLCRTNAGMLAEIQDLLTDQAKVAVPKGTKTDLDLLSKTVRWLMGGAAPSRVHDDLAGFGTWAEVGAAIGAGEADAKVEKIHDLVTTVGIDGLEQLVEGLRELGDPGVTTMAGYTTVTTGHKAKGLQWPRVKIGTDFPAPRRTASGEWWEPGPEELKLAYVAVTRAQTDLDPGSLAWVLEGK
jgi:hypothetical protein